MKKAVPHQHQWTDVVWECELCFRRGGLDRRLRHQISIKRGQVIVSGFGIRRVRKSRVQEVPVTRNAFTHGALKSRQRPLANPGGVGREVGAVNFAKRRVQRPAASIRHTISSGMAAYAVAQCSQLPTALDGAKGLDVESGGRHRRND